MKFTLTQKIRSGFIICILVLLGIAFLTFKNSDNFIVSNGWIDHSNSVLYELDQVLIASIDGETEARAFITSGNESNLAPLLKANLSAGEHLNVVLKLTIDNPDQQQRIKKLDKEVKKRFDNLKQWVSLRKMGYNEAKEFVSTGEGRLIQNNIRAIIDGAKIKEQTLLIQRKHTNTDDAQKFNLIFILLLFIILVILIIVYKVVTANLRALGKANVENETKNWLFTGNKELNDRLIGVQRLDVLSNNIINFLCTFLKANIGAIYLFNEKENTLILSGQYAFSSLDGISEKFRLNEGLIGQVACDQQPLSMTDLNEATISVRSSMFNTKPRHLLITPFLFGSKTLGVIEIGSLTLFNETEKEFVNASMDTIGISVNSATDRQQILELLLETQVQNEEKEKRAAELVIANKELAFQNEEKEKRAAELSNANQELACQTEELQTQQQELKQVNEELEVQTQNLLQQQEELRMSNEELDARTKSLELKNSEVETAKCDIEQKTEQLEISSRYKSEFLANMSHELRTPLNSLLILSKDLSENKKENLDAIQVESAEIIYKSGQELLVLLNDVLDLSKIEAGKMTINIETISLKAFADELVYYFKSQASQKGLDLALILEDRLPEFIMTDIQRLNQILKNLLSNAIKFTENGSIHIAFRKYSESTLIISVQDTGVGIPESKLIAIFEAFQQADGSTSRKYGGTGLGLSISRELAKLLSAEIKVSSKINVGSTFSIIIPFELQQSIPALQEIKVMKDLSGKLSFANTAKYVNYPSIPDNRNSLNKNDIVILIIDDDLKFASILLKQANKRGFKCLVAPTGEDGLLLAAKYKPQAIILDIGLPGISGNQVLRELKTNSLLRHIPVHIISAMDRTPELVLNGAREYLTKPVNKTDLDEAFTRIENFNNRKIKNLLIVEDSESARKAMLLLIGNGDVKCFEAATGSQALALYKTNQFACIILDIGLPDMSGFDLIHQFEQIKGQTIPPIIVYTGQELTREENDKLEQYAESIIIKGVKSEERLLDETALFLHRTLSKLPKFRQASETIIYDKEAVLHSKKILLVDDDARNVFALSKVLSERGLEIIKAENGEKALEMLASHPDINLILMDIMMPVMDGYQAIKQIRSQSRYKNLPVIALTAKAMKDDKQKCIDAGANDYINKPVDLDQLLSLMRVWLSN